MTSNISRVDLHVGGRIASKRIELKLTKEALAVAAGIRPILLGKYESGVKRIPATILYTFAKILGVEPTCFFSGLEDRNSMSTANGGLAKPGTPARVDASGAAIRSDQ